MNNNFIYSLLVLVCCMSCTEERLEFHDKYFNESDLKRCKEVACPEITVDYITIIGNPEITTSINSEIEGSVLNGLFVFLH